MVAFTRGVRGARLRQSAVVEDVDFRAHRGLDRALFLKLASCEWIREHHHLCLIGPTGIGKSWLACALGHKASARAFLCSTSAPRACSPILPRRAAKAGCRGLHWAPLLRTPGRRLDHPDSPDGGPRRVSTRRNSEARPSRGPWCGALCQYRHSVPRGLISNNQGASLYPAAR
jgi:hypothetical protein